MTLLSPYAISMKPLQLIHVLFILSFLLSVANSSFVLQIAEDDEQCLVIRAPPSSLIRGNFDILDDNLTPNVVRVKLLSFGEEDEMEVLYESKHGASEDTFHVEAEEGGRFYICVQNGMDVDSKDQLDRSVGLDVRVTKLPDDDDESRSAAQSLIHAADELSEKLWSLQDHTDYLRDREARHRATTEETFTYVVRWSILELVVLVGIAITQVLVLRVFFERKRYM